MRPAAGFQQAGRDAPQLVVPPNPNAPAPRPLGKIPSPCGDIPGGFVFGDGDGGETTHITPCTARPLAPVTASASK